MAIIRPPMGGGNTLQTYNAPEGMWLTQSNDVPMRERIMVKSVSGFSGTSLNMQYREADEDEYQEWLGYQRDSLKQPLFTTDGDKFALIDERLMEYVVLTAPDLALTDAENRKALVMQNGHLHWVATLKGLMVENNPSISHVPYMDATIGAFPLPNCERVYVYLPFEEHLVDTDMGGGGGGQAPPVILLNEGDGEEYDGITFANRFAGWLCLKYINDTQIDTHGIQFFDNCFAQCTSLDYCPGGDWDMSSALNINGMYAGAGFKYADLRWSDTSSLSAMGGMFAGCPNLKEATLDFETRNVVVMTDLFSDCPNLETVSIYISPEMAADAEKEVNIIGTNTPKLNWIDFDERLFCTGWPINFSAQTALGMKPDGTDNGWLEYLAETAPEDMPCTIRLSAETKAIDGAQQWFDILEAKGFTIE